MIWNNRMIHDHNCGKPSKSSVQIEYVGKGGFDCTYQQATLARGCEKQLNKLLRDSTVDPDQQSSQLHPYQLLFHMGRHLLVFLLARVTLRPFVMSNDTERGRG